MGMIMGRSMVIATEAGRPAPSTRPNGPMGAHGALRIRAERLAGRTRLVEEEHRPPLQVMRAMYLDGAAPDLASITISSAAGGVLQGDRLVTQIAVGPGARLRVGTQSATRVYRAPVAEASVTTTLSVAASGYLEFLPDPWIPFAGSRVAASTRCVADPDGTLVLSETVTAGRLARGEVFAMGRFESLLEVERPDGELVARDCVRLDGDGEPRHIGRFGGALALATLIVVHRGLGPGLLRDALEHPTSGGVVAGVVVGASELPGGAGAWLRVLGPDARSVEGVIGAAVAAVRMATVGSALSVDRRP